MFKKHIAYKLGCVTAFWICPDATSLRLHITKIGFSSKIELMRGKTLLLPHNYNKSHIAAAVDNSAVFCLPLPQGYPSLLVLRLSCSDFAFSFLFDPPSYLYLALLDPNLSYPAEI